MERNIRIATLKLHENLYDKHPFIQEYEKNNCTSDNSVFAVRFARPNCSAPYGRYATSQTPIPLYAIGFRVIDLKSKSFINFNIILKRGQGEARAQGTRALGRTANAKNKKKGGD